MARAKWSVHCKNVIVYFKFVFLNWWWSLRTIIINCFLIMNLTPTFIPQQLPHFLSCLVNKLWKRKRVKQCMEAFLDLLFQPLPVTVGKSDVPTTTITNFVEFWFLWKCSSFPANCLFSMIFFHRLWSNSWILSSALWMIFWMKGKQWFSCLLTEDFLQLFYISAPFCTLKIEFFVKKMFIVYIMFIFFIFFSCLVACFSNNVIIKT